MTHALVLGYSSIARRRVVPSLAGLDGITVDLASRRPLAPSDLDTVLAPGRLWLGFDAALESSEAELVYISTANHDHAPLARRALESGRHVIVDKPAFLSLGELGDLLDLAAKRGLCLAESTVFSYHRRYDALAQLLTERPVGRAHATFIIPPPEETSYRYDPAQGGGSLYDQGPYAAGVCRVLKTEAPNRIWASRTSSHPLSGVDTGFGMLCAFADGTSYSGQFGFDGEYVNQLWINGPGWTALLDRAYSPPPTLACAIDLREANRPRTLALAPDDTFARFFTSVLGAIAAGDWSHFTTAMKADARFLDRLRRAALGNGGPT
ncbi:MAG: Gfo/Idh/MocA family oxidoreductase [Rhodospirillum sp.]|nr:Gfo/Idh/MocA family oxidoreductase [Rhodospirillum sp.]MCF8488084.1 Gfo/Idh/MocA family oxidoreductase [Rhodospirillum sp.]MCF8499880.1 Gfo/Idh/MocA family oxidoreductase [Rhodospirillum sp.]